MNALKTTCKGLSYLAWIALGALLGFSLTIFLPPFQGQPARTTSGLLTPESGLHLSRQPNAHTALYAHLPPVGSLATEELAEHLRGASGSASPARARTMLNRLLIELAADPDMTPKVVREIERLATSSNGFRRIFYEIFKQWADRDPMAAIASAKAIETHPLRRQAIQNTLTTWAATDPDGALAYVQASDDGAISQKGPELVLNALAKTDPIRALALAHQLGDRRLERNLQRSVIAKQAQEDMATTWAQLDKIEDREWQWQLRSSAIDSLAQRDRHQALDYANQIEEAHWREFALRRLFRDWPLADPDEAKQAFLTASKDALPEGVAFDFGQIMNLTGTQEALEFSTSLEGEIRNDYLLGILTEQALKQPAATAEIAHGYFSDEKSLGRVYRHLGSAWAGRDEHAAAEWLATLPDSPSRDEAVSSFAKKLFSMDPERALQWAGSISDSAERRRRMGKLIDQWQIEEPTAAQSWLNQHGAKLDAPPTASP